MEQRTHPVTIGANLWRVFYLIIFPAVRGFVTALQGGFSEWLQGAWFDIATVLLMITIAVLQWQKQRYFFDDDGIHIRLGLFVSRSTFIRWERISSISLTSPFYLKPIRVSTLRADTLGGSYKNADVSLYLSREKAREILAAYREYEKPSAATRRYEPRVSSILALGLLDSNSFAGVLFLSTFISQSGRLLGNEFSEMLIGTFENLTRALAVGIPPAAAAIGYIAIAGWLIAFARTVLRYIDFYMIRRDQNLSINGGRFTNRDYLVDYDHVNFIDIQQTVGTRVLRLYSMYISAVGYGKRKDDITCVLPPEPMERFAEYQRVFFPSFVSCARQIGPKPSGFLRFLSVPLAFCLGIPMAMYLCIRFIPGWKDFIWFVGLMSMVPSLLFFTVRLLDFRSSGVGRLGNFYTLRYSRGFQLHTVVVPADKIVKVEQRQGLLQRIAGTCDLYFYTPAEGRAAHRCRNIKRSEIDAFFTVIK